MEPVARPTFIAVARIARTRGNRGEVLVTLCTDFPARFMQLREVWLEFADGRRVRHVIECAALRGGRPALKFEGIDSISSAEELVGAWVEIEAGQAASLPEGTYYDHDLIGCALINPKGEEIGKVVDVLRIADNSQLVAQGPGGEFYVPIVADICVEIRIAEKQIVVDLPEGLAALNLAR